MELRELRYLVAIAETGNLARAAERVFVSQPALSYALRRLETELGIRLFDRHSAGVTVTEAGREIVAEARRTVRQADRVLAAAERYRRGEEGTLRIGFEASGAGELTTEVRAEFARRHPRVRLEPRRFDWGAEAQALVDGEVDVAFVWLPAKLPGMHTELVEVERRFVGLAQGHPLAARAELSVLELGAEPLMWTERAPREWVDWWAINPRPDGSEPVWGPTNDNVEEMLEQVAAGDGICFVPESMTRYYPRPGIAWVPVTDAEPLRVVLAWPDKSADPLVRAFVQTVRELTNRISR